MNHKYKDRMSVTRGNHFLELFLSKQRAKIANQLIPDEKRSGTILDIGCGSFPYFLSTTTFTHKVGLDQIPSDSIMDTPSLKNIKFFLDDINLSNKLPLEDNSVDIVCMLAVFEHIRTENIQYILYEISRVLKANGIFIMTTPTSLAGPVLHVLKLLGLVSAEEVEEHEKHYSRNDILNLLSKSPFSQKNIKHGYFEFGLNQWISIKPSS